MEQPNTPEVEQCFCKSYYEDGVIKDCTCGKCAITDVKTWTETLLMLGNQFDLSGSDWDFLECHLKKLSDKAKSEGRRELAKDLEHEILYQNCENCSDVLEIMKKVGDLD